MLSGLRIAVRSAGTAAAAALRIPRGSAPLRSFARSPAARSAPGGSGVVGSRLRQAFLIVGAATGLGTAVFYSRSLLHDDNAPSTAHCASPKRPLYTKDDVAKHRTLETGVWVIYKGGVYNITEFVKQHPGGADKIMLAAGGSVEPFWALYQQHNTEQVRAILEPYRIGDLAGYVASAPAADPYQDEPERLPALRVVSAKPFNAETPLSVLVTQPRTPTELFFVRNHLPTPRIDPSAYRLVISGQGVREVSLSLTELRSLFRQYEIEATIQCSGNRRSEMAAHRPIKGLEWRQGAIGNAVWRGVLLRDVLAHAGFDPRDPLAVSVRHVQFEGLDRDVTGTQYGASIPLAKALSAEGDVLLAFEMNGQPLTRDHGAPLRVIAPGVTGARSVKWLGRVVLSDRESASHWQQRDYKVFPNTVDWDNVDWSSAPAIIDANVQSAICEPQDGAVIEVDKRAAEVALRGYAWSGGGRGIQRVDVSVDGGRTWHAAEMQRPQQEPHRAWAWTLWQAQVALPAEVVATGRAEFLVRACDWSSNTQPGDVQAIWNLRGVMNNAWHRVNVQLRT